MKLRDFVFFRPPGVGDFDWRRRISRALNDHMRFSDVRQSSPDCSEDQYSSPLGINRVSGVDSARSGRVRVNTGNGKGRPVPGTSARPSHVRAASAPGSREKLDLIRQKIASGYYNTASHLEELAEVLTEKIDFHLPAGDRATPDVDAE